MTLPNLPDYRIKLQFGEIVILEARPNVFLLAMKGKDDFYYREAGGGLILKARLGEYFFKGAKTCKTFRTAKNWLKKKYDNDDAALQALKSMGVK